MPHRFPWPTNYQVGEILARQWAHNHISICGCGGIHFDLLDTRFN